jgi:geranyl-CoA carboxylase alpha subunit
MIAKIIAWGEDRDIARRRLVRALQTTCLFGLVTNREFLIDVLNKQAFADGEATTAFIEENYTTDDLQHRPTTQAHALVGACLLYREALLHSQHSAVGTSPELSGWGGTRDRVTHFRFGEEEEQCMDVFVRETQPGIYQVKVGEDAHEVRWLGDKNNCVRLAIDSVQQSVQYALIGRGEVAVQIRGCACLLTNQLAFTKGDEEEGGSGTITAPMHGNVLEIMVVVGDRVEPGQDLAVMEAMKMEHRLSAQVAGEVAAVHISVGEQVAAGVVVLEITADGD